MALAADGQAGERQGFVGWMVENISRRSVLLASGGGEGDDWEGALATDLRSPPEEWLHWRE